MGKKQQTESVNSKQIQTTPSNDEGNKFTFKGKLKYILKIF